MDDVRVLVFGFRAFTSVHGDGRSFYWNVNGRKLPWVIVEIFFRINTKLFVYL